MSGQTDTYVTTLESFGLTAEESRIYMELLANGPMTALKLSRAIHIARTKVYRILEHLVEKQLITRKPDTYGTAFVASDPECLELLVAQREDDVRELRAALPSLISTLNRTKRTVSHESKILYYHGAKGLARVNFNLMHAKRELLSYEIATADAYMSHREAEGLRRDLVKRKIMTRTITNQKKIEPFTNVTEMVRDWWQIRYIPAEQFLITADVFMYNNIFAECHYLDKGDIFCFEMYNQHMVDMQRALFENMWQQAKPMKVLDTHGKASA